jgi:D-lactate dehydrogenase
MSTLDLFCYEAFVEEQQALKYYLPPEIKAGFTWQTIQEVGHSQPPANLISIRTQSMIPLSWADQLQGILSRSTGYDHLLAYQQQTQASVLYGYLPHYCSRAVAEQALLLWLALLRKLPQQIQQFNHFNRDELTGLEMGQKTLLVVGVGNIGYEVVQLGKAVGMQVLGVDIETKHADVNYITIEAGLSQAHILVCAMNLTAQNHHYFNYQRLKDSQPGLIFINVGRGECSPATDLLRLLKEKILGGVALDVYEQEHTLATQLRARHLIASEPEQLAIVELAKHPRAILTPHNAFNTQEAVDRKSAQSIQQVKYFIENKRFLWTV